MRQLAVAEDSAANRTERRRARHLERLQQPATKEDTSSGEQARCARQREASLRPRFISIRAACDYLSVSRATFYKDLLSRLKTARVGRRNLIDLQSLDALADELSAEAS
jgi:hypothetical protein